MELAAGWLVTICVFFLCLFIQDYLVGRHSRARSVIKSNKVKIEGLEKTAELYAVEHDNKYPQGNGDNVFPLLVDDPAPWLTEVPFDTWGNRLRYEYPTRKPTRNGKPAVWSLGPDRISGTEDDITNWHENTNSL